MDVGEEGVNDWREGKTSPSCWWFGEVQMLQAMDPRVHLVHGSRKKPWAQAVLPLETQAFVEMVIFWLK